MAGSVLVYAEQRDGKLKGIAREVTAVGKDLSTRLGVPLGVVLIGGEGLDGLARELSVYGVDRIYLFQDEALLNYSPTAYTTCIQDVVREHDPALLLIGASAMGKDLAPRVAGRLGAGLASDCTDVTVEGDDVFATRPVYAGKAFIKVRVKGRPAMASLRPKAIPVPDRLPSGEGLIERLTVQLSERDLSDRVVEIGTEPGKSVDLTEADIIVSGGRGMKGPENFSVIEDLADALGGVVGASRAAVDAGWRPHSDQVGQTGKVVNPTLYIACGISGAIQHLAGMRSSKVIVAINKDANAPIFKVADYGIVGDLFEVVPRLADEVRKLKE
jgi:electron transfer flavoprotein alpha subunit